MLKQPNTKYRPVTPIALVDLQWPSTTITRAPIWKPSASPGGSSARTTPAGVPVDSWTFTGYGAQASSSVPGQGKLALQQAGAAAQAAHRLVQHPLPGLVGLGLGTHQAGLILQLVGEL